MTHRALFAFAFVLSIATSAGIPAAAQSLDAPEQSAEQIEMLFQKHRGLVLAPSAAAPAAPETEQATTVTASPDYVEIPKEDQVFVTISFDFDSASLRADQKPRLATLCEVMQKVDIPLFRIVGHTDATGSASYNDRLSLLRAQEVKRHLVGECGIEERRLEAVGVGQRFPYNTENPAGEENRRVEFQAMS